MEDGPNTPRINFDDANWTPAEREYIRLQEERSMELLEAIGTDMEDDGEPERDMPIENDIEVGNVAPMNGVLGNEPLHVFADAEGVMGPIGRTGTNLLEDMGRRLFQWESPWANGTHTFHAPIQRNRGFEVVCDNKREFSFATITLPTRADSGSAGYDFRSPVNYDIEPGKKVLIWTDVKVFMRNDDVLKIYIRSSLANKYDIVLANSVGIIDASYYGNPENDGNIGIMLRNVGDEVYRINAGDRIAQGIFCDYGIIDNESVVDHTARVGGFGSSGR